MFNRRFEEALVRLCRTAVGDTLRSIVCVTPQSTGLLYLRRDLRGAGGEGERERALCIGVRTPEGLGGLTVRHGEDVTVACISVGETDIRLTSDDPRGGDCEFEDVAPSVVALFESVEAPVTVPA